MQIIIGAKYRFVIPKEVREKLRIKPGQKMGFEAVGKKIIMSPIKYLNI